jgi:hypothetical protein
MIFERIAARTAVRIDGPVMWAARWSQGDLLPPLLIDALWGGEFWPVWVESLALGLGLLAPPPSSKKRSIILVSAANGAAWYQEWISALPKAVVNSPSGRRARRAALIVLDAAVSLNEIVDTNDVLRHAIIEQLAPGLKIAADPNSTSFARARDIAFATIATLSASVRFAQHGQPPPRAASATIITPRDRPLQQGASTASSLSFKEVVETAAIQSGKTFLPHPRRAPIDGNPIFLFGDISIYISSGVIFADIMKSGTFTPTSLDRLLV